MRHGADFVVADTLADLVAGHEQAHRRGPDRPAAVAAQIQARDREIANPFTKDAKSHGIHGARRYLGDRLIRVAKPHRFLDPAAGPLIAVKLHILTRKSLGGICTTDLDAQVLDEAGPSPASTPPGRSPASAAAASTATTRSKARSSAAASSPDAPPAEQQQRPWDITAPAPQTS